MNPNFFNELSLYCTPFLYSKLKCKLYTLEYKSIKRHIIEVKGLNYIK